MSRRYVVAKDIEGTRSYWLGEIGGWTRQLCYAKRYDAAEVERGPELNDPSAFWVALRPKGAPCRESRSELERRMALLMANDDVRFATLCEARDAARAEVAVIRSERDQMQGRWETARAEVKRLQRLLYENDDVRAALWQRDAARDRVATLEAEVFSLENRLRRQDVPTDGAMYSGTSASEPMVPTSALEAAEKRVFLLTAEREATELRERLGIAALEAEERVRTEVSGYVKRIDELEKQVSAVKGQNRDKGARIAELESDLAFARKHAEDVYNASIADEAEAIAVARRVAIEECLRICERFSMYGSSSNCRDAVRALLTTPTSDDGKVKP